MSLHTLVRLMRYVLFSVVIKMHSALLGCQVAMCSEPSPASMRWTPFIWGDAGLFTSAAHASLFQLRLQLTHSPFFEPRYGCCRCLFRELTYLHKMKREREGRSFGSFFLLWVFRVEQHCRMKLKLPSPCEPVIPITTGNSFFKLRAPEAKNIRGSEQLHCCFVFFISVCSS